MTIPHRYTGKKIKHTHKNLWISQGTTCIVCIKTCLCVMLHRLITNYHHRKHDNIREETGMIRMWGKFTNIQNQSRKWPTSKPTCIMSRSKQMNETVW